MQVFYKIPGPGDYTLLFDETAGDSLETDEGVFVGVIQTEDLAGAAAKARFARGNVEGAQQFKWNSAYASAAAARAAVLTIDALKLQSFHLKLVEGATTHYLPNAIAAEYRYRRAGQSVEHTLSFKGDDLTDVEPA